VRLVGSENIALTRKAGNIYVKTYTKCGIKSSPLTGRTYTLSAVKNNEQTPFMAFISAEAD